MEEIAQLVLLHATDVLRDRSVCGHLFHREAVGVEILPMLNRNTARIEELPIGSEGPSCIHDRGVA